MQTQDSDKYSDYQTQGICKQCRRKFKAAREWQKFCSTGCRNDFHVSERKRIIEQAKRIIEEAGG